MGLLITKINGTYNMTSRVEHKIMYYIKIQATIDFWTVAFFYDYDKYEKLAKMNIKK